MNDNQFGAFLEHLDDQFKAIQEGQAAMADVPKRLNSIDDRLSVLETDVKTIKLAVQDQSHVLARQDHTLGDHEVRLSALDHHR